MDRGRTFLAAGLALVLGCTLGGAEAQLLSTVVGAEGKLFSTPVSAEGKLFSTSVKAGQALMLRPALDAVPRDVFCVRARGAERAGRAAPGWAEGRRDASRRGPQDRPARDARSRGGAKGHLLTGPEMALAGVLVIWGSIVIAGRLRRWAARSR